MTLLLASIRQDAPLRPREKIEAAGVPLKGSCGVEYDLNAISIPERLGLEFFLFNSRRVRPIFDREAPAEDECNWRSCWEGYKNWVRDLRRGDSALKRKNHSAIVNSSIGKVGHMRDLSTAERVGRGEVFDGARGASPCRSEMQSNEPGDPKA